MNLNALKEMKIDQEIETEKPRRINKDIAIIGLDAKISCANSAEEFWQYLEGGCDLIHDFPEERKEDANRISLLRTGYELNDEILQYGYLDRIDLFDPDVFGIMKPEAILMDPNQRLFLQTAWRAIEDAGYGGDRLNASRTGVYIGVNNIQDHYGGTMDEHMDPALYGLAVSGNVNSIVASRISYHLNLKGPAVVFDTACSSSLVAVHFACQQLKSGEVSTAIVGGIRVGIIPPQGGGKHFGIEAFSGRTRSYDSEAEGTGGGEGVVAMVLKRLEDAIQDHDHIYAVIKSSAINQDGASVGITAPNASSQEACITQAWKEAGIDPETISYIEGHGTATELGDPIEITGIERAFRKYTDKKQFCAIGSVKSNVGHLDSAAGIVGLLKVVLMMKYKKIPASIHFIAPNRNINFIQSPVYINDTCVDWYPENGIRRAGVSSFGISGTNCHLIVEEYENKKHVIMRTEPVYLLTVTGKTKLTTEKYFQQHKDYLAKHKECNLSDYCYTSNTGRTQFNFRLVVLFHNVQELLKICTPSENCFYGEVKIVENEINTPGYITVEKQNALTENATALLQKIHLTADENEYFEQLKLLCSLYVHGANINWKDFYDSQENNKISIPTYPFNERRYWHDITPYRDYRSLITKRLHPLIDSCIADSYNIKVFEKVMNPDICWELKEHMINGEPVLPGSALLEMAYWGAKQIYKNKNIEFNNLQYISPLYCATNETRIVHLIVTVDDKNSYIRIVSKEQIKEDWMVHLEVFALSHLEKKEDVSVSKKLLSIHEVTEAGELKNVSIASTQGSHWNNLERLFISENQIAVLLDSSHIIQREKQRYFLYPPTLDTSLNAGIYLIEGEYLPFSFARAVFYSRLPDRFYSFIQRKQFNENTDLVSFDIQLCTEDGKAIADIFDYTICRVRDSSHFISNLKIQKELFYKTEWIQKEKRVLLSDYSEVKQNVLIICRAEQNVSDICEQFSKSKVFLAIIGAENRQMTETIWLIRNDEESFRQLFSSLRNINISKIIQFVGYESPGIESLEDLNNGVNILLKSTMLMIKSLVRFIGNREISIALVTKNGKYVCSNDKQVNPLNTALIGMGTCIEDEYNNLKVQAIDVDHQTSLKVVYQEVMSRDKMYLIAYREGIRYVEKISKLAYSEKTARNKFILQREGVYVIAGGLGGMGLVIMQHLFEHQPRANIVLLNRSFTEEELLKDDCSDSQKEQTKRQLIMEAKKQGYEVEIIKVDISNYPQLKKVFEYLRAKYNKINGIINAAGLAGDGFIYRKNWDTFKDVLQSKIYGSWNLDRVSSADDLDFFIMFSSQTAIFGAPGQSDYAAANAFLDGFTYYRKLHQKKSLTIDWTGWREVGMAASNDTAMTQSYVKFISNEEGALAFTYAIKSKEERILIGQYNMDLADNNPYKLNDKIVMDELKSIEEQVISKDKKKKLGFEDIAVYGKNTEELTKIEKQVVCIWANVLNTTEVDVYDKFFEIGGNSLLAVNLQKALNSELGCSLTITDIFVYSSIIELANYIISGTEKKSTPGKNEMMRTTDIQDDSNIDVLFEQFMNGEIDSEQLLNV